MKPNTTHNIATFSKKNFFLKVLSFSLPDIKMLSTPQPPDLSKVRDVELIWPSQSLRSALQWKEYTQNTSGVSAAETFPRDTSVPLAIQAFLTF